MPALNEFMARAAQVLEHCERAVRTGCTPRGSPGLRPSQQTVAALLAVQPGLAGDEQAAGAVVDATDRIANSLDTLVAELRRQLGRPAHAASTQ
jgi:hypothetical protein